MSATLSDKVKNIISRCLAIPIEQLDDDTNIVDGLNVESIVYAELILALEDEFEADMPDEESRNLRTVADVVTYVQARTSG